MSGSKRVITITACICVAVLFICGAFVLGQYTQPSTTSSSVKEKANNVATSNKTADNKSEQEKDQTQTIQDTLQPFSYSKHQACGVKSNVYCVLLTDFNVNSDWKQRIDLTISKYITKELGGGAPSNYLIYFFQNNECYEQKIASRATEMCSVADGEVAASSWGKTYYECGE